MAQYVGVFDRHDFSFKWTFVEFNASSDFLLWAVEQVVAAYKGIAELIAPAQLSLLALDVRRPVERLTVQKGLANSITSIPAGTITNITVDPPYYDNVQYAELADFFYVWLKRSVGHLFPEFFTDELTNKDAPLCAGCPKRRTLMYVKWLAGTHRYSTLFFVIPVTCCASM